MLNHCDIHLKLKKLLYVKYMSIEKKKETLFSYYCYTIYNPLNICLLQLPAFLIPL